MMIIREGMKRRTYILDDDDDDGDDENDQQNKQIALLFLLSKCQHYFIPVVSSIEVFYNVN